MQHKKWYPINKISSYLKLPILNISSFPNIVIAWRIKILRRWRGGSIQEHKAKPINGEKIYNKLHRYIQGNEVIETKLQERGWKRENLWVLGGLERERRPRESNPLFSLQPSWGKRKKERGDHLILSSIFCEREGELRLWQCGCNR